MATAVVMPRQGNTVESCLIVEWKKEPGDEIAAGEVLCEVETDKAVMEVESPVGGSILALFFNEGDLVPVLENIAAVGAPGEAVDDLRPSAEDGDREAEVEVAQTDISTAAKDADNIDAASGALSEDGRQAVSPRARRLAASKDVDLSGVSGSGPSGRVIERDVEAALAAQPRLSPVAQAMVASGGYEAPSKGTGPGGRVMSRDLSEAGAPPSAAPAGVPSAREAAAHAELEEGAAAFDVIPVQGVRRVIADRMRQSLLSTAQLTMNRSVDATSLLEFRRRLKASDETLGLREITINDLVLFVTARTLARFQNINALYLEKDGKGEIHQYHGVHLAFAVDTPRGLIVPVLRNAERLSLRQLAAESSRLAAACLDGTVLPDEITGGTFTVTNLGSLGVESFTPILNPPQVGILGVGGIVQRPVALEDGSISLAPHLNLSLTINHQVVDGAPGARFLAALAQGLTELDLMLAT